MIFKIIAAIVAAVLLAVFIAPVVLKLQDAALWSVALIGFGAMLVVLWQSLRSKAD